ncbi:MAG: four helix bundle protein [Lentisphaeria bacterium]|jgi:four helix bundle protein
MKRDFRDLVAWQKAMDLAVEMYRQTQPFPREEIYGLTSQMRRAAVSVPSNIAEGQGKMTKGEFLQALGHAKGSLGELETQTMLAQRLGFLPDPASNLLLDRIGEAARLLNGLLNSLHN